MERETGFEPATSTLARLHSTAELLPLVIMLTNYCTRPPVFVKGEAEGSGGWGYQGLFLAVPGFTLRCARFGIARSSPREARALSARLILLGPCA